MLARDCSREAGGQRLAHMGEPQAEGGRWLAPRHPAARPLLPGALAAAGNRVQPVTFHPVRERRQEGTVWRVRDITPWHGAKRYLRRGVCGAP